MLASRAAQAALMAYLVLVPWGPAMWVDRTGHDTARLLPRLPDVDEDHAAGFDLGTGEFERDDVRVGARGNGAGCDEPEAKGCCRQRPEHRSRDRRMRWHRGIGFDGCLHGYSLNPGY